MKVDGGVLQLLLMAQKIILILDLLLSSSLCLSKGRQEEAGEVGVTCHERRTEEVVRKIRNNKQERNPDKIYSLNLTRF